MLTFKKGEDFKYIDENSSLIEKLKANGWELVKLVEEEKPKKKKEEK